MAFGESVDPSAAIRAILGSYPFSAGIFRELIQNSDDAKATKQIFILDHRTHQTSSLYDPKLAEMQGPAFLAYNNALFTEDDWTALQNIHRSSKKIDTSKIGKYGIGFRSCYHITDGPQILSGSSLAILDPCHDFSESGGVKLDSIKGLMYAGQLASFDSVCRHQDHNTFGSTIRLPLRRVPSSISEKLVQPSEIRKLLGNFIQEELSIVLLFLENVTSIEVYEIDGNGDQHQLAVSTISRGSHTLCADHSANFQCSVRTTVGNGSPVMRVWCVQESIFPKDEAISLLSARASCDPSFALLKHKLQPHVALAIPLNELAHNNNTAGRLFTYLPLPLPTGCPVHIHGLFALTPDRQHLRNGNETGIVDGSDDKILVEWNQLLFDIYIPRSWASLLQALVDGAHVSNIYDAWPPEFYQNSNLYNLSHALIRNLEVCNYGVWPVNTAQNLPQSEHLGFKSVLISTQNESMEIIQALTKLGLKISCPPQYICKLLKENSTMASAFLTPGIVHARVLGEPMYLSKLKCATVDTISVVLQYLISGGLHNTINLPLFPTVNGEHASLVTHSCGSTVYTLLDKAETNLFGRCEHNIIPLDKLEHSTAKVLATCGPGALNVQLLKPEVVVDYFKLHPDWFNVVLKRGSSVIQWLSDFWTWMGSWKFGRQLYPLIATLCLIPSCNGPKPINHPIYVEIRVHPVLLLNLKKIGVPFLHSDLPPSVRNILASFSAFSDLNDLHCLLGSISVENPVLSPDAAQMILDHIASCSRVQPLSEEEQHKLKNLPIFPILNPPDATRILATIPRNKQLIGILATKLNILPVMQDVIFLDGSKVDISVMKIFDPNAGPHLSDSDLLLYALDSFQTQSLETQVRYVEYIAQNRNDIPPHVIKVLQGVPFITTESVSTDRQAPQALVDPYSHIAPLFCESWDRIRIPQTSSILDGRLIYNLRLLGVMQHTLTTAIVEERITFISNTTSPSRYVMAQKLLEIISVTELDCTPLKIPAGLRWLPTKNGLLSSDECRDYDSELFSHILPLLDTNKKIPQTLRIRLGWNKPIPLVILTKQLSSVLEYDNPNTYRNVKALVKELSSRGLDDLALNEVHDAISKRPWVPISSGQLVNTSDAVFSDASPSVGFFQIPFTETYHPSVRRFLLRMGCPERPTEIAIIAKLRALEKQSPSHQVAQDALTLLRLLSRDISEAIRVQVVVPATNFKLLPVFSVYYNDIGERACLIDAKDVILVHPDLDEDLATSLSLRRLGFEFSDAQSQFTDDMGEQLTTTIRKSLREYTERQLLIESLANASDAKATDFGILIDKYQSSDQRILSPKMKIFQRCPSLLIYNNAVFTDADFRGIIKTGIGSKEGRTDSIGQFGLGALTMFHITELVMIVSGDKVLLINPSKTCFPIRDRATWLFTLNHIKRIYPDHLHSIDGLFGFDASSEGSYNGTLFRLPLRNESHLNSSCILTKTWTVQDLKEIVRSFEHSAHEYMLFTNIKNITFRSRESTGHMSTVWEVHATHQEATNLNSECHNHIISIQRTPPVPRTVSRWNVVTQSILHENLSEKYPKSLPSKRRLRSPITIGLAAPLHEINENDRSRTITKHKIFSTVPLPLESTLPVHLTAPFILSSDRRQIRLDEYDNEESSYNRWLLSSLIPPLYLILLEDLLHIKGCNRLWWPGNIEEEDVITRIFVESFYATHLNRCKRAIFRDKYNDMDIFLNDARIFEKGLPEAVKKVILIVQPDGLVSLPSRVSFRAIQEAKCTNVTPAFVKNIILRNSDRFTEQLTYGEVHDLIGFIQQDSNLNLIGLPLLPLADGSFAIFENDSVSKYFTQWVPDRPLFPPRRFVHHEFFEHDKFSANNLLNAGLNVAEFTSSAVRSLIGDFLPETPEWNGVDSTKAEWIANFWIEFPRLPVTHSDISSFPLIRTSLPERYVSIDRCRDRSAVILVYTSENRDLCDSLTQLGLQVVSPGDLSHELQQENAFEPFTVQHLLLALRCFESNLSEKFNQLDVKSRNFLVEWVRKGMFSVSVTSNVISVARRLPIWPVTQVDGSVTLCPADRLTMLPPGIKDEVAKRFLDFPYTEHSTTLAYLISDTYPDSVLTFSEFVNKLSHAMPTTLRPSDVEAYKSLLKIAIPHVNSTTLRVLVPDSNHDIRPVRTLYARDPLFLAAFIARPQNFILPDYEDLEPQLFRLGLKRQVDLGSDMFTECALAIQDATTNTVIEENSEIINQASVLFQVYGEDLPLRISSSSGEYQWRDIDAIRFVPRAVERRLSRSWANIDVSAYVKVLPAMVAPNEMVISANEAIVWTQRALFREAPHERVLIANPRLGCPKTSEVVEHLRVLALRVSRDLPSNNGLLSDLTETYKWLEQHSDEAGPLMIQYRADKLFLNVSDPSQEEWEWRAAKHLLLEADDDFLSYKPVREFLLPFRQLLTASGVNVLLNPEVPEPSMTTSSDTAQLKGIRAAFQSMRESEKLTDVRFKTSDEMILHAHRSFLATCSTFFYDSFTSKAFREGAEGSVDCEVLEYSRECVELVLGRSNDLFEAQLTADVDRFSKDYAYKGEIPDVRRDNWGLLLEIMALANYWDFKPLHETVQLKIIELRVINPISLENVKAQAEDAQATIVMQACREYESKNRQMIRDVRI